MVMLGDVWWLVGLLAVWGGCCLMVVGFKVHVSQVKRFYLCKPQDFAAMVFLNVLIL